MKFSIKAMTMGIALAVGASGALTAAPALARTQVYLGVGTGYGGPGYYDAGYRDGYRGNGNGYRGDNWRGGNRDRGYRDRDWDRRNWRGGNRWQGGYRQRCWTEWRGSRYNGRVPVRICR